MSPLNEAEPGSWWAKAQARVTEALGPGWLISTHVVRASKDGGESTIVLRHEEVFVGVANDADEAVGAAIEAARGQSHVS